MHIYLVGGAVRDALMGLPVKDRDWVVVGATPQQMVAQGYTPVGRDFPVFLHPRTREEYALARTERKTAPGYRGFTVHADPDVTLEQDLERRDLRINAMALDARDLQADGGFDPATDRLIDPFNGRVDLQRKLLRHVGDAFGEDPVRILRVARFAARFADFEVAHDTMDLMRSMVAQGEVQALVAERVWQELSRGLMQARPSRMLEVLHACGALPVLLPELQPEPPGGGAAVEVERLQRVDRAARLQFALPLRFACLLLGTAQPPAIARLCERLRVAGDCRALAELAAREHACIDASGTLDARALLLLLERCDAFRKPERFAQLLQVCACAAGASEDRPYAPHARLLAALVAAQSIATQTVALQAQAAGLVGHQVGVQIHAERIAAIAHSLARSN